MDESAPSNWLWSGCGRARLYELVVSKGSAWSLKMGWKKLTGNFFFSEKNTLGNSNNLRFLFCLILFLSVNLIP
jgi:hypothetical protein